MLELGLGWASVTHVHSTLLRKKSPLIPAFLWRVKKRMLPSQPQPSLSDLLAEFKSRVGPSPAEAILPNGRLSGHLPQYPPGLTPALLPGVSGVVPRDQSAH